MSQIDALTAEIAKGIYQTGLDVGLFAYRDIVAKTALEDVAKGALESLEMFLEDDERPCSETAALVVLKYAYRTFLEEARHV